MPEPHILFTVVQGTPIGIPAFKAAWRAGAWPSPAGRTQPISTSSMRAGSTPLSSKHRANGDGAELGGRNGRKGTQKSADGRPSRGADHDFVRHLILYLITAGHPARSVH